MVINSKVTCYIKTLIMNGKVLNKEKKPLKKYLSETSFLSRYCLVYKQKCCYFKYIFKVKMSRQTQKKSAKIYK